MIKHKKTGDNEIYIITVMWTRHAQKLLCVSGYLLVFCGTYGLSEPGVQSVASESIKIKTETIE